MPNNVESHSNAMSGLKPPPPLKIVQDNMSMIWSTWKQQFDWYVIASGLKEKPAEVQAAVLMTSIGADAITIFNTFGLNNAEAKNIDIILNRYEKHFSPTLNESYVRWKFFCLRQADDELFDEFLTQAKTKLKFCNFGLLADSLLRDKIVYGIKDDRVREKLLAEPNLTLEKAIQICKIVEQATKQLTEIKKSENKTIERVEKRVVKNKMVENKMAENKIDKSDMFSCKRCGTKHKYAACPAYNKRCGKCNKLNHFSKMCRSKNAHSVNTSINNKKDGESVFLGAIDKYDNCLNYEINTVHEDWFETVKFKNKSVPMKLDTGAQCNVISLKLAKEIGATIKKSTVIKLVSFSNHEIKVSGEINTIAEIKGKQAKIKFIVAKELVKPILGGATCSELGLIQRIQAVKNDSLLPDNWKSEVFNGLGCLKNYEYDIDIEDNAHFEVCPPRRIPYAIKDTVKAELDRMVKLNVITPITEPSPSVSPLVIVKKNEGIRLCIDPTKLNKFVKRRHFPLKTLEEIAGNIKGAKYFALLDCRKGFWQLKVTDRTSKYLTVNTPWGRYAYKRIPFGLVSAPEIYQQKMSEVLEGINQVECSMDDILLYAETKEELRDILNTVLERIFRSGLRLNKEKCILFSKRVKFLGHILDENGISPDPEKIKAIQQLKEPTNVKELRRFLGMANYLGKFLENFSSITEPLRKLLEKENTWEWSESQSNAVTKIKELLSSAPVLGYYNVNDPVTITVDASSTALGAVLSQNKKPIAYATKSLTKSQRNYPQIEKEALAIRFGCEKFHQYIYGKKVTIETDHKPLEIIARKPIIQAPPRLQRIFYDILQYNPEIVYCKGTSIPVADTLSRDCNMTYASDDEEEKLIVNLVVPMSESALKNFKVEVNNDSELTELKMIVQNGWPESKDDLSKTMQNYWNFRDELSIYDGLLFKGERIIIPEAMKTKILDLLHDGHLGIQSSLRRARNSFFWYGMTNDIEVMIKKCSVCQSTQLSKQKEPVHMKPIPEYPWQRVGSDLFHFKGKNYIVIADSYSGFYDFKKLKHTTSRECIKALKEWFAVHGSPEVLESDNGTQYVSREFKQFLKNWQIKAETSSPYHPQSNGLAERAVQAAKVVLKRCRRDNADVSLALLNIRNTPRENGLGSINQRLFSRTTRSLLPTTKSALLPNVISNASELLHHARSKKTEAANIHTKEGKAVEAGGKVCIQQGTRNWVGGKITKIVNPRSAIVQSGDKSMRRNTANIKPTLADLPQSRNLDFDLQQVSDENEVLHSSPPPPVSNVPSPSRKDPVVRSKMYRTRYGRAVRPPEKLNL